MSDQTDRPAAPPIVDDATIGQARLGHGAGGKRVNLVKLAEAQKHLLWCVLGRIGMEIGGFAIMPAFPPPYGIIVYGAASLVLLVVTVVLIVRMAKAYGTSTVLAVLGGIAIVVPCAGLLLLLFLNQRVTGTLQRAGAKVGLMGVNAAEMTKLRNGYCWGCGYELRGLAKPICPECGAAIVSRA